MGAQACRCAMGHWDEAQTPSGNPPSRRRASRCTLHPTPLDAPPGHSGTRSLQRTSDRAKGGPRPAGRSARAARHA
eukprot:2731622-Alexandrium_andersonii.AAC.1